MEFNLNNLHCPQHVDFTSAEYLAEAELLQDTLTCGSCQKVFVLSEIVKFIQHKVHSCNKENILLSPPVDPPVDGDAAPLAAVPSISAPICNRKNRVVNNNSSRFDGGQVQEAFKRDLDDVKKQQQQKEMPVIKLEVKDPALRCSPKSTVNAYTNTIITEDCSPEDSLEFTRHWEPDENTSCVNLEEGSVAPDSRYESFASNVSEKSKENYKVNKPCDRKTDAGPFRMSHKVTIPKTPFQKFRTDDRIKSRDQMEYKEENFQSQLRLYTTTQTKPLGLTKGQPFHLTEGKERKNLTKYKSLVEEVAAFQKTPYRFHGSTKRFQPQEHWEPPPLTARSPQLQAVKRRRLMHAPSKEEREEKEVQEMKAHVFHARPLDRKIYASTGVQKRKAVASERKRQFKARPVPTNIHSQEDSSSKEDEQMKNKKPDGPPPITVPWTKRCTSVQPFSFDRYDQDRLLHKQRKIQEIIESETKAHVFHAQYMPSPAPAPLPAVEKKPPTVPEPFNFPNPSTSRNSRHRRLVLSTDEEVHFKAQPATVLERKPFVPKPCPKPEIEIKEFHLSTEKRAAEKELKRELKEAEEREREQALLLLRAQEEEREREELKRLRSKLVHKAQPIRQFKPIEIKPSSVPLTKPESPDFEIEKRLQSRQ